jgi:hypothetical protein
MTGDVLEAQRSAGHSQLTTTQLYLQHEDYGAMGAVSSAGKLDMELYKNVEHDVLLEALGKCNKDLLTILNVKIAELQRGK